MKSYDILLIRIFKIIPNIYVCIFVILFLVVQPSYRVKVIYIAKLSTRIANALSMCFECEARVYNSTYRYAARSLNFYWLYYIFHLYGWITVYCYSNAELFVYKNINLDTEFLVICNDFFKGIILILPKLDWLNPVALLWIPSMNLRGPCF